MAEVLLALADGRDIAALSENLHDELLGGILRQTAHKHCLAPRGALTRGRRWQVCSKDAQQSQKQDSEAFARAMLTVNFPVTIQMFHNRRKQPGPLNELLYSDWGSENNAEQLFVKWQKSAGFDEMLLLMVLAELRCTLDFRPFVFT